MATYTALVLGAHGVIGRNVVAYLATRDTWRVKAVSRRPAGNETGAEFRLQPHRLGDLAAWPFGDFIFNVQADAFFDVNKARRFGFHEMHVDSGEEIVRLMRKLQGHKVVPG